MNFNMDLKMMSFLLLLTTIMGAPSTFDITALGKSSEMFAVNLYQQFAKEKGNLLISPASLQTMLAVIQQGANGQTLNEISRVISLPIQKSVVQKVYEQLLPHLRNVKHATLDSANKIYIREGFDINPNFVKIATDSFDSDIESKDFSKVEESVKDINEWVENKTNKKIKNLVNENHFSSTTVMVILNALYFNGDWEYPFDKSFTFNRRFYLNSNETTRTPLMMQEVTCKYYEDKNLNAKFLELPYSKDEFTMTFVLPNDKDGLSELENKLPEVMQPKDMEFTNVIVSIPKFKIEKDMSLNDALEDMGMIEAFQDAADLSDFTVSHRDLKISKVIQKTFIDVHEKGTEAAAASAGFVVDRIGGTTHVSFTADRPFLFFLRQTSTGIIEFMGRFTTPAPTEPEVQASTDTKH